MMREMMEKNCETLLDSVRVHSVADMSSFDIRDTTSKSGPKSVGMTAMQVSDK